MSDSTNDACELLRKVFFNTTLHSVTNLFLYNGVAPACDGNPFPLMYTTTTRTADLHDVKDEELDKPRHWCKTKSLAHVYENIEKELEPKGGIDPDFVKRACYKYCWDNMLRVSRAYSKTLQWFTTTSLSQCWSGKRGTFEPGTVSSTPCAMAFVMSFETIKETMKIEKDIVIKTIDLKMLEYYRLFVKLQTCKYVYMCIQLRPKKFKKVTQKEFRCMICTACCYGKTEERGKLKRRAIISMTPYMRFLLYTVEELALNVLRDDPNSLITIGGVEKLQRIKECVRKKDWELDPHEVLLTGDHTKFNEYMDLTAGEIFIQCLCEVSHFAKNQENLTVKTKSKWEQDLWFDKLLLMAFKFLKMKRIFVEPTMTVYGKCFTNNHSYTCNIGYFSDPEHFKNLKYFCDADYLYDGAKTLKMFNGMAMGMLNRTSTLLTLIARNYFGIYGNLNCLESSDDYIMRARGFDVLREKEDPNVVCQGGLFSITLSDVAALCFSFKTSLKKTFAIYDKPIIGEMTSNFIEGNGFITNAALETPGLNPVGKNYVLDLYNGQQFIRNAMINNALGLFGASFALTVLLGALKSIYVPSVDSNLDKHYKVLIATGKMPNDPKRRLFVHGGIYHGSISTLAVSEDVLLYKLAKQYGWDDCLEYILKINNPQNPVTGVLDDMRFVQIDSWTTTVIESANTTSVLKTRWAGNRTVNTPSSFQTRMEQKATNNLISCVRQVNPNLLLKSGVHKPRGSTIEVIHQEIKRKILKSDLSDSARSFLLAKLQETKDFGLPRVDLKRKGCLTSVDELYKKLTKRGRHEEPESHKSIGVPDGLLLEED